MENLIFYFSGTGNCLKAAKTIAKEFGSADIVSMGKPGKYVPAKKYDSIGFVYPVYFWGLPKRVIEFIENLDLGNNKNAYYYSIATYGGSPMNAVYQIYELLLKRHGVKINNAQKLKMFSNYIIMYDMSRDVDKITKQSDEALVPIINSIKNRENNSVSKWTKILAFANTKFINTVADSDKNYRIGGNCTGCGICMEVCPVKNIVMENSKPQFKHNCEQCLACIQYCPEKAINYLDQTQARKRYTHPEIDYRELSRCNNL